jgi:hypothetical protein
MPSSLLKLQDGMHITFINYDIEIRIHGETSVDKDTFVYESK